MLSRNQPSRFRRIVLLAAILFPSLLKAHDPLDCTSRLTVAKDHIQLTVTMGLDGVREILTQAGFSAQDCAETIAARGPDSVRELPITLATHFSEMRSDGNALAAHKVSSRSDGMEVEFRLDYARQTGPLELEAIYFNHVTAMRPGWLVVNDQDGNQLFAALLSSADRIARVPLPPLQAPASPSQLIPPITSKTPLLEKSAPERAENLPVVAQRNLLPFWMCCGGVGFVGVWLIMQRRRKMKGVHEC